MPGTRPTTGRRSERGVERDPAAEADPRRAGRRGRGRTPGRAGRCRGGVRAGRDPPARPRARWHHRGGARPACPACSARRPRRAHRSRSLRRNLASRKRLCCCWRSTSRDRTASRSCLHPSTRSSSWLRSSSPASSRRTSGARARSRRAGRGSRRPCAAGARPRGSRGRAGPAGPPRACAAGPAGGAAAGPPRGPARRSRRPSGRRRSRPARRRRRGRVRRWRRDRAGRRRRVSTAGGRCRSERSRCRSRRRARRASRFAPPRDALLLHVGHDRTLREEHGQSEPRHVVGEGDDPGGRPEALTRPIACGLSPFASSLSGTDGSRFSYGAGGGVVRASVPSARTSGAGAGACCVAAGRSRSPPLPSSTPTGLPPIPTGPGRCGGTWRRGTALHGQLARVLVVHGAAGPSPRRPAGAAGRRAPRPASSRPDRGW